MKSDIGEEEGKAPDGNVKTKNWKILKKINFLKEY
jgi:hypothetical protein